ncbi:MAG: FUSC family protein, partial [Candidatus Nanopelagicales bacterium]
MSVNSGPTSHPTPTRTQLIARAIRSHQPSASGWPSAIRRGMLVGIIVAVGAGVGEFATAATIAVGALNLGLVDPVVPRRLLAATLAAVTVATAFIAFVAAGVAGSWWAVAVLMALAYVSGAIGSSGLVAFNMTFMALVTGVLFTNDPGTWAEAAHLGALVLVGSLLQGASTLIAWRPEREASIRRSYTNFVDAMRAFAVSTDSLTVGHLHAASAQMAAEAVIDSAGLSPAREQRFRDLLEQLSWTRLCLSNWIATGQPTVQQRAEVGRTLDQVAVLLQWRGARRHHRGDHDAATLSELPAGQADPTWSTLAAQIALLERAARDFAVHSHSLHEGTSRKPTSRREVDRAAAAAVRTSIPKLLRPGAAGSRHALRLALAVGVAEAIALGFSIERGYWIVLTVVMVVKPDFSTTLVRGLLRVVGTAAAVVVAGAVLSLTSNPQWLMVALVFIFAPLTMRWITANYAFASFA